MTRLIAIVAMTPSRVIGRDGTLPWHLPEDLAFFKRTTSDHAVIMGRKTFESIGRPLPKRRNIVLTRDPAWTAPGVEVVRHLVDLSPTLKGAERAYVLGGAEIYALLLNRVDEVLVSRIHAEYPGDTRFPPFEASFPTYEVVEVHEGFEVRRYFRSSANA